MTPKQRRLLLLGTLLIVIIAISASLISNLRSNLIYYYTPSQISNAPVGQIRVAGMVKPGSISWNASTETLTFTIVDEEASINVLTHEAPAEMFREGIAVVLEGQFEGDLFEANRMMVKHSSEYRAPEDGSHPDKLYVMEADL